MTTAHGAPNWGVETTWRLVRGLLVKQRSSDQLYCAFDGQCGTKMDLRANEMSRIDVSVQEGACHCFRICLMHGWIIFEMTKSPLEAVCVSLSRGAWLAATWESGMVIIDYLISRALALIAVRHNNARIGEASLSWDCSRYTTTVCCGNHE